MSRVAPQAYHATCKPRPAETTPEEGVFKVYLAPAAGIQTSALGGSSVGY
jgi:hypothetical protein